jgi:hypothetical protein
MKKTPEGAFFIADRIRLTPTTTSRRCYRQDLNEPLVARAAQWHLEPVIRRNYDISSRDDTRHGGAYLRCMKKSVANFGGAARIAFAKVGLLMASSQRSGKPLHPTNLHVAKTLFPNDTVQSKLPDPDWMEHGLDSQISFGRDWEAEVVKMILHNLSSLFSEPIRTVQELSRYRKQLVRAAA